MTSCPENTLSSTMKASQLGTSLISSSLVTKVYGPFKNRVLPSSSCRQAKTIAKACVVWDLRVISKQNRSETILHLALDFVSDFWEMHYALCRITQTKLCFRKLNFFFF